MKSIAKTIGGSGLSISGVLLILFTLSGLDRQRIKEYGIMHELKIFGGSFYEMFFVMGIVFIIVGVLLIIWGVIYIDKDQYIKEIYDDSTDDYSVD